LIYLFVHGASALSGPGPPYYRGFTIKLKSPDQRPLPDNTQHSERLISMPPAGFETAISASERPKTHALIGPAAGIRAVNLCLK